MGGSGGGSRGTCSWGGRERGAYTHRPSPLAIGQVPLCGLGLCWLYGTASKNVDEGDQNSPSVDDRIINSEDEEKDVDEGNVDERGNKVDRFILAESDSSNEDHYLSIFFNGLQEVEEPYTFLLEWGVYDMLRSAPFRVLPMVLQLIIPIKNALNIRDKLVIVKVLKVLKMLVACDEEEGSIVGQALVPYYQQILPVLNIFIRQNSNLGGRIDYGQQKRSNLGELVMETLEQFELHGGQDAFINIKYLVPVYQSIILG